MGWHPQGSVSKIFATCAKTFANQQVLVPKAERLLSGDTIIIPLNWKLKTATQPFWAPHASESTKKGFTVLAGITDSDYKGETGLLLHKNMSGIQEIQQGVSQYNQAL